MAERQIAIAVVYALPDRQALVKLAVPHGTTIAEAVAASGLIERFAEISRDPLSCAIYGRVVPTSHRVEEGDRIEILRPLTADPKENRRQAAARARRK